MKIKGIARYPHLLTPSSAKGADKLKYGVQLLIHKTDPICAKINKTIKESEQNKWPNKKPKELHTCFKDLAVESPENTELKDYMFLKCQSNADYERPILVNESFENIIDPSFSITGKYVWVDINIASYEHPLNSGTAAYLQGTLVTNITGEIPIDSLSSKPSAETMFSDINAHDPSAFSADSNNNPVTTALPIPPTADTSHTMTEKAEGRSREDFIAAGWTDELLIKEKYMIPPNGIAPSFE